MAAVTDPWVAEAIDLRKRGLSERAIADAVGKAASTVHAALAKAKDDGLLDDAPARGEEPPSSNGNGNGHGPISPEDAERLRAAAEGGPMAGQIDIEGNEVQPHEAPPEEIIVTGTTPLDFFNAGGTLPNKASLKFIGGKVGLSTGTAFKKGDRITFEGYATVVTAAPRDKRDKSTGIVVECELQILAEIDDLRLA